MLPKYMKEVRIFLGMMQYYRDLWQKYIHIFVSLTEIAGGKMNKKLEWHNYYKKGFENTKHLLARDNMVVYPNF